MEGEAVLLLATMKFIAERMAALGNETRLGIYRLLVRAGQGGLPVSEVSARLEIPASTISHHLHRLIRVGLVRQERQGTTLICRADYSVMQATFEVFARECCADDGCICQTSRSCCAPAAITSTLHTDLDDKLTTNQRSTEVAK